VRISRGDLRLITACGVLTAAAGLTRYVASGRVAPFVVAALALAALAALVGRSVDHLGDRLGSGATGALQSALGNLPELFFAIFALRRGLLGVVQATLVGSVLANVLLVLGLALIAGGVRHGTQRFSAEAARLVVLLLLLSVAVLAVPTIAAHVHGPAARHERALSDVASVILLAVFVLSVPSALRPGSTSPEQPAEPPWSSWSMPVVLVVLALAGAAAALVSDWFVTALRPGLAAMHMSQAFAGLVVVAIAGNAVEHVVGIKLAARNRMDYALAPTLQSPVQIALVLIPALVLSSNVIGGATLTLVFPPLLVVVLAVAAVVAVVVVFDGESTWIEGVSLVGLYAVIAVAFWWG
jgi:Ca2+:H+ antiporter